MAAAHSDRRYTGPGTTPSPSPTESIAPYAVPSEPSSNITPGPICNNSGCSAGILDPGTYTFGAGTFTPVAISFTVPPGWAIDGNGFVTKHADEPGEVYFAPWVVTHIFPDACLHEDSTVISAGTTVAELANVLAAQKSRTASATTDVTVGGLAAKHLELTVPADLDLATCTGGTVRPWPDPGPNLAGGYCCLPAGSVDDVSIVDVGGKRVVIIGRHQPGSSAADQAELQAIVDSVIFPPPGATPSQ
jgi:hypothetical protein